MGAKKINAAGQSAGNKAGGNPVLVTGTAPDKKKKREAISLARFITLTTFFSVVIGGGLIGYFAFEILKDNKFKDTMAIYFLEMDFQSEKIHQELHQQSEKIEESRVGSVAAGAIVPDIVFLVSPRQKGELVRGRLPGKLTYASLQINDFQFVQPMHVVQLAGREYLTKVSSNFFPGTWTSESDAPKIKTGYKVVSLFAVDFLSMTRATQNKNYESLVYVINRNGSLLYTNNRGVSAKKLLSRPLVQSFIDIPIRQGQMRFKNSVGDVQYGFHSEVRRSNVILFSETPEQAVIHKIYSVLIKTAIIMLVILVLVLLAVQYPVFKMTQPINSLIDTTIKISRGDFKVEVQKKGFREIGMLATAFSDMAVNLSLRDGAIAKLVVDKQERARLERELEIAKDIQNNLLPSRDQVTTTGLSVASLYEPAEDVAGDWYGVYHCELTGRSYYTIADVSGHGTGSSMFTSMIAALFIDHQKKDREFVPAAFFESLHRTFRLIGKNKWHVTAQVLVFSADRRQVTILNAGHVFPVHLKNRDDDRGASRVQGKSTPLGLGSEVDISTKTIDLMAGDSLFLFTDGLTERKNKEGKQYGTKKVVQTLTKFIKANPEKLLNEVRSDWEKYCSGHPRDDDTCLIAIKVV